MPPTDLCLYLHHMFTPHVHTTCLHHMPIPHVYTTCLHHMPTPHVCTTCLHHMPTPHVYTLPGRNRCRNHMGGVRTSLSTAQAFDARCSQFTYLSTAIGGAACPSCMWRQTGSCAADGTNREPDDDEHCSVTIPTGASGFCDCNGNNAKDASELGYDCSSSPTPDCNAVCSCGEIPRVPRTHAPPRTHAHARTHARTHACTHIGDH